MVACGGGLQRWECGGLVDKLVGVLNWLSLMVSLFKVRIVIKKK